MNASAFIDEWPAMLSYAVDRKFRCRDRVEIAPRCTAEIHASGRWAQTYSSLPRFLALDQSWIQEWFDIRKAGKRAANPGWEVLDEARYNARAFVHPRRGRGGRRAVVSPHVWHFHGYKPKDVVCWLDAIHSGAWPIRAWHTIGPRCRQGRCRWKPIRGSGCRYFGRIEPSRCFLRTYTYLLVEFRQMIRLADSIAPLS